MTIQYPQNRPLAEQVVALIEDQIHNRTLNVGDKLPTENQLAAKYKVSRTVIRSAIETLRERGWVETFIAKGTFIVHNTKKGVFFSFDSAMRMRPEDRNGQLMELRLIIEPECAALSALRADDDVIAKIKKALSLMEDALEGKHNIEEFLSADFTFHMTIAESTGNLLLPMVLNPTFTILHDARVVHVSTVRGRRHKGQYHHRLLMDAIERHDPEAARLHMRNHITQQITEYVEQKVGGFTLQKSIKTAEIQSG
jgi:GntR family transcriptional repressor for pyruvate dehydrogenase complex